MNKYKAKPISRQNMRDYIKLIRKKVGMENLLEFPIVEFVENVLPIIIPEFELEIVSREQMGTNHGETYPSKNQIKIREDVYLRAINGVPRDRMTLAHEVGHLFLHVNDAIALCRMAPGESLKRYEDPEWQANCFAGELLAPAYLIQGMSVNEIQQKCKISHQAAEIAASKR